ncbi:MAG: phospholipase D family protein [Deltaproteobacteria bacterium]|nr:phospholipase D family protein [Deltaproteobacteria bacterium]
MNYLNTQRPLFAAIFVLLFAVTLAGCTGLRRDVPRPSSEAWLHPEETPLGRALDRQIAGYDGQSGFYLLDTGLEALSMRAGLAENAQRTLDLQYYTLHEDVTTQLLLYRVLRAAQRGVRVRLLIDDLYAVGRDFDLATFSAHPNIEVRIFNPFLSRGPLGISRLLEFLGDSTRLNRRMHNKLWIADNAAAIVGGRNLGDEYFDAHHTVNFSDLDALATGPVVRDLSRSFDEYWNSEWALPVEAFVSDPPGPEQLAGFERILEERLEGFRDTVYARALRETRLGRQLLSGQLAIIPAGAKAIYDKPAKLPGDNVDTPSRQTFPSHLRMLFEAARNEVILISPYFIPSEQGIGLLSALVRRGVRVRILTNSLASTDVPVVHAGYARVRESLLAAGVELFEMRPNAPLNLGRAWPLGASSGASLHAKAVLVDQHQVLIGSMNLDPRSRQLNTEVAVLLESDQIGAELAALFAEAVQPARVFRVVLNEMALEEKSLQWITAEDGKELHYDQEPAGFWRRFFASLLGRLAPDELL